MSGRSYEGPALDGSVQYIGEAPYWQADGETVGATPEPDGEITTEGDVDLDPRPDDDVDGQTTWDDWGWSA